MTNPMWITIEEMVKSLRGFTKTNFETFSILPFQHFLLTEWMHRFCKISSESFYLAIFSTVKLPAVDCLG